MQSKDGRRIAGNLSAGQDLLQGLRDVCRNHAISTGEVRGIGYLQSALFARYDGESGELTPDEEPIGPGQLVSLLGNVSQAPHEISLHLQAVVLVDDGEAGILRAGRLLAAEVVDFEFFIVALDDFGFLRGEAEDRHAPWIQVISEAHTAAPDDESQRPDFLPGRLGVGEPTTGDYELRAGDSLEHPRLGRCVVLQVPDEDRASIRLESGRVVELHLGLLRLERLATEKGRQTFRVHMRRRG